MAFRMNILALDLGTKTGWALQHSGGIASGTRSFAVNRCAMLSGVSRPGIKFFHFQDWLLSVFKQYGVDMVAFEDVRNHSGVYSAHAYGGFQAIMAAVCEQHRIPYRGFAVKTIKKSATGYGNASKDEVIQAMQDKGFRPIDDNEADALALLLLAQEKIIEESNGANRDNKGECKMNYKKGIRLEDAEDDNKADALALLLLAQEKIIEESNDMNRDNKGECKMNYKKGIRLEGVEQERIVEESNNLNRASKGECKMNYRKGIRLKGSEVENRIDKCRESYEKVFVGPCKYSEATGKSLAASRYRQNFLRS